MCNDDVRGRVWGQKMRCLLTTGLRSLDYKRDRAIRDAHGLELPIRNPIQALLCYTVQYCASINLATDQLPPPTHHQSRTKYLRTISTLILNRKQQTTNPRKKRKNGYEMLSVPVQMALTSCSNYMVLEKLVVLFHTVHIQCRLRLSGWH